MKNKFLFLTRESIKKKIGTKSFKIINIFLCILIIGLVNLDSIIKFFGGDFNELVNIYVVDEIDVYDEYNSVMESSYLDLLQSYNAKIVKADKSLEELKEEILKEEKSDIILHFIQVENPTYEHVFDTELISYEYVDSLLYTNIVNGVNTTKISRAMTLANIDQEVLASVYKGVEVNRVILNTDIKENEEFMELIGAVITIIFVVPIFILVTLLVQMIGAEINEEKTSKSMEIIISSVSPQVHFMSKLIAANVFAILQGAFLLLYAFVGTAIRYFTMSNTANTVNEIMVNNGNEVDQIFGYLKMFLESDMFTKLLHGIPFFLIIILLSFFAYSLLIGVLASVTTSMEDYNQIQTPVMVFLMLGYFISIYAAAFQGSSFIKIAAYVPFLSGIVAPVMYTLGEITIGGLCVAILLLIIVCFLLYKYGLKVYKVGILNYSSSNLWQKIFKAMKD